MRLKSSKLASFFPKLIDFEVVEGGCVLRLEDLTAGGFSSVVDFKLSNFVRDHYCKRELTARHGFHIPGLQVVHGNETVIRCRDSNVLLSTPEFFNIFKMLFRTFGRAEFSEFLRQLFRFIDELADHVQKEEFGLNESSVLILVATESKRWRFRVVDLTYNAAFVDPRTLRMLEGIKAMFARFEAVHAEALKD